ncbi:MAG: UDP-N-acetylmuramyl-tripeptide synthetase [Candidatus Sungbacteria bacterium]|uniref:UDP-N-acetylmuramyl-tripeptide synthetase n=1 Tax=Candidatus Sungiibacteriota bacterium TaxID=2750080 RepID=A0A9D6QVS2_9BACT|nr:UDP-N-acetylmuramyl-tripeptide synthetase [Candidatus Sungbacteria bacterium]
MESVLYGLKKIIPEPIFRFFQPMYHRLLAGCAAAYYGFPARGLVVIGVTGTNGKSTVVEMVHEIFAHAGISVGSLSSVRFKIKNDDIPNQFKMTLPGRFVVQQFLSDAKKAGATHVILEVTSEGVKQFRHWYIPFAAAVLTNLTPEHIEAHGGFENYKKAKGELFKALGGTGISVVNLAERQANYFLSFPAARKIGYALDKKIFSAKTSQIIAPSNFYITKEGITLYFKEGWGVEAPLHGRFNAENMLAAIATALQFDISHETIRETFENFRGVPGRMEEMQKEPFRVIVDYAFTPNALRQVYQTLLGNREQGMENTRRNLMPDAHSPLSELICVLGAAGGGRDRWKRPELGKIAGEYCREVIITNEDPYDEDPRSIMHDVEKGVLMRNAHHEIIEDRRLAIRDALESARPGDVVIITGKGSETTMAVAGGKKIDWNEREIVREELKRIRQ